MTTETNELHAAIAQMQLLMTQAAAVIANNTKSLADSHTLNGIITDTEVQATVESDTDLVAHLRAAALPWDQRQGNRHIVQTFDGLPMRKLNVLLADGWNVNGVSIERTRGDGLVSRGAVTTGGMVLWWNQEPTDSMGMPVSCGKPLCSPGDHHPLCKLAEQPAPVQQDPQPPYEFERYVAGSLMAQGVRVERATTLADAMRIAAKICPLANPPSWPTVLVYTSPQPAQQQEPVACLSETQARAILDLALALEKTGRLVAITEGQERTDFVAQNRSIQCALEDALRNATAPQPAQQQEPVAFDVEKWLGQPSYHDGFGRSPDLWSLAQIKTAVTAMLAAAPQPAQQCTHRIADARNPVVKSWYICIDCGALFSAADHTYPQPAPLQGWKLVPIDTPDSLARRLYQRHPYYRGTVPFAWEDAPESVRLEWLETASKQLASPQPAQQEEPIGHVIVKTNSAGNIVDFEFNFDAAEQLSEGKYPAYTAHNIKEQP